MDRSTHHEASREALLAANRDGTSVYGSISSSHPMGSESPQPDRTPAVELQEIPPGPEPPSPVHTQANQVSPIGDNPTPITSRPESVSEVNTVTPSPAPGIQSPVRTTQKPVFKEWRSWKIQIPWLSFMLFVITAFIVTIGTLDQVSRRNFGFVRLGDAPSFITNIPGLGNPIWTQGILYTAFPAFLVTVYRTMWEATVMAFADRQPYVELKKPGGGPPSCTIDLDYRTAPPFLGWYKAFQNRHLLLAACMFCSALLALLVVPLTSFLFTPIPFALNGTTSLSVVTAFSNEIWRNFTSTGPLAPLPDVRLSMSAAGAVHIQAGRQPRWTIGKYAFGQFALPRPIMDGTIIAETFAYSAFGNCITVPDSDIEKQVHTPDETGIPAIITMISALDRGCRLVNSINFRVGEDTNLIQPYIRHWSTFDCPDASNPTRFSFLSAIYNSTSSLVSNFSLVSCAPSYRSTPGSLHADINGNSSLLPTAFVPSKANSSEFPTGGGREYFELGLTFIGRPEPMAIVDSNTEFGYLLYQIANQKNAASFLAPNIISTAAEELFGTTFSIFASSILFPPAKSNDSISSFYSRKETRMIVVPYIAYIIIAILTVVAILTILLFVSRQQESMLVEEPVGLLGYAGLLYKSSVLDLVETINKGSSFDGRTRAEAELLGELAMTKRYQTNDENEIREIPPA